MSALTGEGAGPPPAGDGPYPPGHPRLGSRWARRWARIRWTLLLGWLIVVVATLVTGERTGSWHEVQKLVAAGDVDTVRIVGELPVRGSGYSVVEVHWRDGLTRYTAEVVHVLGRSGRPRDLMDSPRPVVHAAPSARLRELQPGLIVIRDQQRSSGGELLGQEVTSSLALAAALLFIAGIGVLVAGPSPWWATRWAWFWLWNTPFGVIAFLVASGPTPGLPGPRAPRRRLSGGWAFLLSMPLAAVLAPYRW